MKTGKILFIILIMILVPLTFLLLSDLLVKKSQAEYSLTDNSRQYISYDVIRCNLLSLEYVFVDTYKDNHFEIYFHKIKFKNLFSPNKINWDDNYIGGTDIKNTTFPELVKMVKKDCSQFQEDYNNPDPNGIDWGYREAEPPAPPKTLEEISEEEYGNRLNSIKAMKIQYNELFTDLQKEKFAEFYGDINSMTDDEIYEVVQRLAENDRMVDNSIIQYFIDQQGNPILKERE